MLIGLPVVNVIINPILCVTSKFIKDDYIMILFYAISIVIKTCYCYMLCFKCMILK